MSIKLMSAAWELDIPSAEKMVLMCLCDYANDEGGNCWPSIATLARKCSKGERTVQGAIRALEELGYLTTIARSGTSNSFQLDPRKICTPAQSAPPQKTTKTPAKSAPNPPRTTTAKKQMARAMPDGWKPLPFESSSKCHAIIAAWPAGELETQIEHFVAHHRGRGSRFVDWQDAWKTWALNSRKWGATAVRTHRPANDSPQGDYLALLSAKQGK